MIQQGERVDELNRKDYKIIQNPERFCFGMDAVLLSHFASVKKNEKVLDIGTGTGIIPILLEARYDGNNYVGLEIQEEVANMAKRSVKLNNLENKIEIVIGDVNNALEMFGNGTFDVVTTNPPYMTTGHGVINPSDTKALSRHEISATLEDIICKSSKVLKNKGRFYMVHRPARLVEIMNVMRRYNLEIKRIRMVHPFKDKEANMVLIEAVNDGKPFLKVEPPLIIYKSVGEYTDEVMDIYYS